MIKIDGFEVAMEGSFGQLIKDAASAIHSVSKAASEKFKNEGGPSYDEVVEQILEELTNLKKYDIDGPSSFPVDAEKHFLRELKQLREEASEKGLKSFLDFDTTRPDKDAAKKIIRSAIDDVYLDPRANLDQKDISAISNAGKKKKKKNKKNKKG